MNFSNKYLWYGLDLLIFFGLNVFLIWFLHYRFIDARFGWLQLLVFGLAVFRLANIVSNEQLTKPLRQPFVDEKRKDGKIIEIPKKRGFAGAFGSLIYCPSCTGTWLAATLVYCYVVWPLPTQIIAIIFALSGTERLFTMLCGYLKK